MAPVDSCYVALSYSKFENNISAGEASFRQKNTTDIAERFAALNATNEVWFAKLFVVFFCPVCMSHKLQDNEKRFAKRKSACYPLLLKTIE
jgi:hypothetical protein